MARRPPTFTPAQLESLCRCLGDTESGLTGAEIGHFLRQVDTDDPDPTMTKWKRLYNALVTRQGADGHGGRTLAFIHAALDPPRYAGNHTAFEHRRQGINVTLAFVGLEYRADGNSTALGRLPRSPRLNNARTACARSFRRVAYIQMSLQHATQSCLSTTAFTPCLRHRRALQRRFVDALA